VFLPFRQVLPIPMIRHTPMLFWSLIGQLAPSPELAPQKTIKFCAISMSDWSYRGDNSPPLSPTAEYYLPWRRGDLRSTWQRRRSSSTSYFRCRNFVLRQSLMVLTYLVAVRTNTHRRKWRGKIHSFHVENHLLPPLRARQSRELRLIN
jgi:hypothetical protein